MIINTGQRTDIPAFYSEWFANRLREGYVCVRNPFHDAQVSLYKLSPSVVDLIGFCTKNPAPMFRYWDLLQDYGQYWFVTVTPYGKDIEPNVPDKHQVLEDVRRLSGLVGSRCVGWRYDPIFVSERYTVGYHLKAFGQIAEILEGCTDTVVISFIDLYHKVCQNFPEVREVPMQEKLELGKAMIKIAAQHGMTVRPCAEGDFLAQYGADCSGCMTVKAYEKALGKQLHVPSRKPARKACACYLACDIGAYDSCMHLCRYCYANHGKEQVRMNYARHDPKSPFLIGNAREGDVVHDVPQKLWADGQMSIFDF